MLNEQDGSVDENGDEFDQSLQRRDTSITSATCGSWCVVQNRLRSPEQPSEVGRESATLQATHCADLAGDSHLAQLDPQSIGIGEDGSVLLLPPQAQRFRDALSQLISGYATLSPVRQQALLVRDRANYQRSLCESRVDFVLESEDVLWAALCNTTDDVDPAFVTPERKRLREQLREDRKELRKQMKINRNLERDLSRLEYMMEESERSLADTAQSLMDIVRPGHLSGTQDLRLDDASSQHTAHASPGSSSNGSQSLLAKYHGAVEEVHFLRQHLVELEDEHRELRVSRIFREDQGKSPSISDEEFEATYQEEYHLAELDVLEALENVKAMKAACLEQGLESGDGPEYVADLQSPISAEVIGFRYPFENTATQPVPLHAEGAIAISVPQTLPGIEVDDVEAVAPKSQSPTTDSDIIPQYQLNQPILNEKVERWRREAVFQHDRFYDFSDSSELMAQVSGCMMSSRPSHALLNRRRAVSSPEQFRDHRSWEVFDHSLPFRTLDATPVSKTLF